LIPAPLGHVFLCGEKADESKGQNSIEIKLRKSGLRNLTAVGADDCGNNASAGTALLAQFLCVVPVQESKCSSQAVGGYPCATLVVERINILYATSL